MTKSLTLLLIIAPLILASSLSHLQPTAWTGPTTWAVSEAETNYQNITNLNAPNWIVGNQTIDDYNKNLFDFITKNNVTKCPIDTPFLRDSDSQCINCKDPKPVFDLSQKDCVACPEGTKHNPTTHQCEKSAEPPKPSNKCTANYVWSDAQNKCVCPDTFPIDLGCECVKCLEPFVWNTVERTCKLRCDETHIWNKDTQKCECPSSTPYEVNGECIACSGPFEWKAGTCQLRVSSGCGVATTPSTTTTTTTPSTTTTTTTTTTTPSNTTTVTPSTNTSTSSPTSQVCNSNYVWDATTSSCVCPTNLPFNTGSTCVQCNLPQYWDASVKQCLNCSTNKYFNTNSRLCESCPAAKPLWRNYLCEACPAGTTYNQATNTCA